LATEIETLLKSWRFKPQRDSHNNIFVTAKAGGDVEKVFFSAHLDTVEPGTSIVPVVKKGWIESKGDTILGADNKVSVASILFLLQQVANKKVELVHDLEVLFTTSEEIGNYGAIGFNKKKIKANIGYVFDSSNPVGTIISESPFYARFDITVNGTPAHAGYPKLAEPAIPVLMTLVDRLESLRKDKLLITIGKITGGTARNTIIGQIKIEGEVRSVDEKLFNNTLDQLRLFLSKHYKPAITHELVVENPGYSHDKELLVDQKLKVEEILGERVAVQSSMGVSDANIFNKVEGLNVFNIGDGSVDSHTTKERIKVKDLNTLSDLVIALATQ
jgi:tripeptide aminopeptidase